jgi:8-oxo-dGTP pyrophosphatase MutT (NUDIX family)
VHGKRTVYESPWIAVDLVDVEIPGGERFEHHVVRFGGGEAAAVVVHDPGRGVLLLWRHRFVSDRWQWEIPAGRVEAGESAAVAAARETLEETGWRPGPLRHAFAYHPMNAVSDHRYHVFLANGAEHVGDPSDWWEVERVEWVSLERVREAIRAGEIPDGYTLTALLWLLLFEV